MKKVSHDPELVLALPRKGTTSCRRAGRATPFLPGKDLLAVLPGKDDLVLPRAAGHIR